MARNVVKSSVATFLFEMDGAEWAISITEDANADVVLQYGT